VKCDYPHSKLKKQPYFAENFKIQGGQTPSSDAHAAFSERKHLVSSRLCQGCSTCGIFWCHCTRAWSKKRPPYSFIPAGPIVDVEHGSLNFFVRGPHKLLHNNPRAGHLT